jgi:hypothetical protein
MTSYFCLCAVALELATIILRFKGLPEFPESLYCLLLLSFSLLSTGKGFSAVIPILVTWFTNALAAVYKRLWVSNSPPVPRPSNPRP